MDFTQLTDATCRAELLGPDEHFTRAARVRSNVADLTHPSVSATRASLRTFTTLSHGCDGGVTGLALRDSRDAGKPAESRGSAPANTGKTSGVQAAGRGFGVRESTHRTHLDLHEVTEGRWASGELVRGRERGARQYLRRDSGEFARVHHHQDGCVARGVLLGALGGVALWAVTIALGFALFGLLGCSAASQLEGELGDLTQSLAADNADESVLSALGGGQSCTSTEQCARGSYCAVTSRRGHMQCRVVAR